MAPPKPFTSDNNPLVIAELPVGPGMIGMTLAPGKQQPDGLTGHHKRSLHADLDAVAGWNAAAVVTLMEQPELQRFKIEPIGTEVKRRHLEWHHWPIPDGGTPGPAFEADWSKRSAMLRSLLACGGRVLIHCRGGQGRTGMIAARLLVEGGVSAAEAIARVRAARKGAIETVGQEKWVAAGKPAPGQVVDRTPEAAKDRAVGALLGLALGDALGAAIEFSPKPKFAELDDMKGGGPFGLKRGQWTDDTAMALALADSLLHDPALDPADLMRRFVDWHHHGTYSCTGVCFDIGSATSAALTRFEQSGDPLAGSTADSASGNGALMRLSPVAIRHWQDQAELLRVAELQTRTTHGSPATLAASRTFALMVADAIAGVPLADLLSRHGQAVEGAWRGVHRGSIRGTGYVVDALRAAVWAVARTTDFRSAVLLAANLGEDSDTTAAIAGQLAGAVYGRAGLPADWLKVLAWRDRLERAAERLFEQAIREEATSETILGDEFAAMWAKNDWTLRERLEALAAFVPAFSASDFRFAKDVPVAEPGVYHGVTYTEAALRFIKMAYDFGWVRIRPWTEWRETPRGRTLMQDASAISGANEEDLADILTCCCRADRFADGYLGDAWDAGLLRSVVERAEVLLEAMPENFRRSYRS